MFTDGGMVFQGVQQLPVTYQQGSEFGSSRHKGFDGVFLIYYKM